MGASTAAGAKLYIGTTATDASTDTYTEVAEVIDIPAFGRQYNEVTYSPLSSRGVQKFKGSYNDGSIAVRLGKDASDEGQAAILAALDTDFDYNFKIEANDKVAARSFTVTISVATPGVFTAVDHGLAANTEITLATSAADLPAGLSVGTYYVKTVLTDDTFTVSATLGGAAVDTTDAGTGTHTVTTVPANTYQLMKAKVLSYTTEFGTIDNIIGTTAMLSIKSGTLVETAKLPSS
jgi:hypothetical protein